jgi:hypothetical protein
LRRRQTREPDAWLEPEGWHSDDDELSWLVPDDDGDVAAPARDKPAVPAAPPVVAAPATAAPTAASPVTPSPVIQSPVPDATPTTPSGLPQRVRGSHVDPAVAEPAQPTEPAAVSAPTQRAPEQVFELLARYEAGRRRGMTAAHTDDATPGEPADAHVPEER